MKKATRSRLKFHFFSRVVFLCDLYHNFDVIFLKL